MNAGNLVLKLSTIFVVLLCGIWLTYICTLCLEKTDVVNAKPRACEANTTTKFAVGNHRGQDQAWKTTFDYHSIISDFVYSTVILQLLSPSR